MKKIIFVLSFVFSMLFASTTTFAATESNNVCEKSKSQIVLTESFQTIDSKVDYSANHHVEVWVIRDGDRVIIIVVVRK